MDAEERLLGGSRSNLEATRHHRVPRRDPCRGRHPTGLAARGRRDRQPTISGHQAPDPKTRRGLRVPTWSAYKKRVPGGADLVCYWFEKAGRQIASAKAAGAGLVATNSIRGGWNLPALQAATDSHRIFEAWSDEPWVNDGAAVRVSLICFSRADDASLSGARLNGQPVNEIHTDLTARRDATGVDLTRARRLPTNARVAFVADQKGGPFDIPGDQAREWLCLPANPNGRLNADVLKPWVNGMDLTRRPTGKWIVDFGRTMSASDAALYEAPFRWVKERVYSMRVRVRRKAHRLRWWRHADPRPGMWEALDGLSRYIATPTVAKHRLFAWCDVRICPDHQLIVIARDDDATFGILHSRFHELWSLRLCTWLGKGNDPRYTPSTTFETFPFPIGLAPDVAAAGYEGNPRAAAISEAARRLVDLRDRWLNPPEWVEWVDEPVPGYPRRPVPRDEEAAKALRKRTLTNLYNARPQWLVDAHVALDAVVAAAYGWSADNQRRRRPARAVGSQRGLVSSPALLVWCCGGNEVHGWRGARRPPSRLP